MALRKDLCSDFLSICLYSAHLSRVMGCRRLCSNVILAPQAPLLKEMDEDVHADADFAGLSTAHVISCFKVLVIYKEVICLHHTNGVVESIQDPLCFV